MDKYILWQYENKSHLIIIYNIISNNLKKNNIEILDEKNLYLDVVRYLYKTKI